MELLIHSKNKKLISRVKKIVKPPFKIIAVKENHLKQIKDRQILLIDITDKKYSISFSKDYINTINSLDTAILLLIKENQIDSVYDCKINLVDFILERQLEFELNLRVRLILKEKGFSLKNSIIVDELILNLDKYELVVNKKPIELTFKEYELLKLILKHQDKVFTREELLSSIWDYDYYGGSRTVDVHIRRLRAKLPSPYNLMIKTIRNVGYMFSAKS